MWELINLGYFGQRIGFYCCFPAAGGTQETCTLSEVFNQLPTLLTNPQSETLNLVFSFDGDRLALKRRLESGIIETFRSSLWRQTESIKGQSRYSE